MSETALGDANTPPHGTSLLPRDLTPDEFAASPVFDSVDQFVIDDLTDDEYERFLAALAE